MSSNPYSKTINRINYISSKQGETKGNKKKKRVEKNQKDRNTEIQNYRKWELDKISDTTHIIQKKQQMSNFK